MSTSHPATPPSRNKTVILLGLAVVALLLNEQVVNSQWADDLTGGDAWMLGYLCLPGPFIAFYGTRSYKRSRETGAEVERVIGRRRAALDHLRTGSFAETNTEGLSTTAAKEYRKYNATAETLFESALDAMGGQMTTAYAKKNEALQYAPAEFRQNIAGQGLSPVGLFDLVDQNALPWFGTWSTQRHDAATGAGLTTEDSSTLMPRMLAIAQGVLSGQRAERLRKVSADDHHAAELYVATAQNEAWKFLTGYLSSVGEAVRGPAPAPRNIVHPDEAEQMAVEYARHWGFADAKRGGGSATSDGGIDVDSKHIIGQVKHYTSSNATRPEVQNLYGVATSLHRKPVFFSLRTPSGAYTPDASAWGTQHGVALFEFNSRGECWPINVHAENMALLPVGDTTKVPWPVV